MSKYELIALDMDGTLLNSQNSISLATKEAIETAIASNKHVVLATGRAIVELDEYTNELKSLAYGILESGALIYDFKNKKIIHQEVFDLADVYKVIHLLTEENYPIHLLSEGNSILSKQSKAKYYRFINEVSKRLFDQAATIVDDLNEYVSLHNVEKINIYHPNHEACLESYHKIKHLPLAIAIVSGTSLEISPLNVTKGTGLKYLCNHLNLNIKQTIMVGDSNNDTEILKVAGLAVAMDNAIESIKAICDVVVSDNDHDGCKEAIEKYLI